MDSTMTASLVCNALKQRLGEPGRRGESSVTQIVGSNMQANNTVHYSKNMVLFKV
ncbi:hypothetical protein SOV_40410 [Sporomusa ovata DSM 2662]|nr:hypothetical protein SOV_3c03020 [Sporomusa ovata DSM 2662]